MATITLRVRSVVWFVTGAALSAVVVLLLLDAWRVDAAPGDTDSTFAGITPCRLADTRPAPNRVGPAAAIGPGGQQTFAAVGEHGQCSIPTDAVALSLNVTALGASEQSFLTIWPAGERPLAASLNPAPGQPPVPNAVTVDLSDAGGFNVYNERGTVDVVIDVNGYYTASSLSGLDGRLATLENAVDELESAKSALEAEVAALQSTTASMSVEDGGSTVRFTGVDLQVVDGTGDTDGAVNGRGNLIVGYNGDAGSPETRTGSHNLIVGDEHSYTSYGGAVLGYDNSITGIATTVTGGFGNEATNLYASVSGGIGNTASGFQSSVSGGFGNEASGDSSSVSGGGENTAAAYQSSVSGGSGRTAPGSSDWRAGSLFEDS